MQGVRGARKNPGKFRDTQNWIGKKDCTITEATYVPPSPLRLNDLLHNNSFVISSLSDPIDQLFFGLEGCKCTCVAGAETAVLTENMMLHIPIGSTHTISVEEGDKLYYIWLDFFLTLEGQKYMGEQHKMKDE